MKLLVADDQHSLHLYLDRMMNWKELGIREVRHTYDGKETLHEVRAFQPQVLILDIRMPFMSGLDMLKELEGLSWKPKTIILSAHDEFEYAREALQLHVEEYLLKPVDISNLQAAMTKLVADIHQEYHQALSQEFGKWVHAQSLCTSIQERIDEAFCVLRMNHYLLLEVRGELPAEKLPTDWMNDQEAVAYFDIYRKSPDKYAGLLGLNKVMAYDELVEQINALCDYWTGIYPNIQVSIGISQQGTHSDALAELFRQSEEASLMYFYSAQTVNVYKGSSFHDDWGIQDYQRYEKQFKEKISYAFHREAIQQLACELFEEFRQKRLHPEKVYAVVLQYAYAIGQVHHCRELKWSDGEELSIELMRKYRVIHDLEAVFIQWIRQLGERPEEAQGWSETIRQVKQYVELHYGEDVSLQTVSHLFSIDRYQLSRLFKQEYRMNYWSYVIQVRMNKAAELLTGTPLKNSAIAEATGFVDESHFSRVFKKYYSMTPKQYRQTYGMMVEET